MDGDSVENLTETDLGISRSDADARVVEGRGATVEEATMSALAELGIERANAQIDVVSEAVTPALGESIAGKDAVVRVQRLDDDAVRIRTIVGQLLAKMDIPATITVRRAEAGRPQDVGNEPLIADIVGDDLGLLIGWHGETLSSFQFMVNLMMGEREGRTRRFIVDVEHYRARREARVKEIALRAAHTAKRTGQQYMLDPMMPYERRIVHLAVEGDTDVSTESVGQEPARRVVIHPTGPAQPDLPERFGSYGGHREGGNRSGYGERPRYGGGGGRPRYGDRNQRGGNGGSGYGSSWRE